MGILRVEHEKNYTSIDNRTINDERISWDALGLLTWFLSKPNHWEVRIGVLTTIRKAGKDKIGRMLKELADAGYVERRKIRDENGAFRIDSIVRERPISQSGKPAMDGGKSASHSGLAGAGEPAPVNPPLVNTDQVKTEKVNIHGDPFKKPPAKQREAPWPSDLKLNPEMRAFAIKYGLDPDETFSRWRDYCLQHGKKYVDWMATWRNWCRSPFQNGNGHHPAPDTPLYHRPLRHDIQN